MKKLVPFAVLFFALSAVAGHARESGLIITVPSAKNRVSATGRTILLRSVTDNRKFEDRPQSANIPSLAATLARTTPRQKSLAVARARDGYGKARHNIFMAPSQPVEAIVRQVVANALTAKGYTVVSKTAQAGKNALVADVSIGRFWGYINIAGGAWGGGRMTMEGEMTTVLTINDGGKVSRLPVSARASHLFRLMTGGHWSQMFGKLLSDYLNNFVQISF